MSSPALRTSTSVTQFVPDGFTRAEGKQLTRRQNAELARGLVAATRVQAAATVAGIGLQATAMLSREATFQADGDPVTANRLNYIVDQFANYAGNEVARFGR
ncbi:hypothetical protein [Mycobacteroides abscessus]|uniref:hypothetical protein n=1 Tax=Mycobacteroides abscessus TaxID=36809 RepID=UPI0009A7FE64|nr:hypothetical protein [Mycobacteroides abscessus]RIT44625.1 hypothetical protein D2E80_19725 [Mycobacteroides abscessus]SKT78935.1 Uncharacterised protein [Mycobacteroides abscessus subsp. massiliense]SKU02911.1 Uncharacterised protein [Mycobacteroides abscessus subsp. massiliense]